VKAYIDWALQYTKGKIAIVIVDKIQDTNFFVRNKRRTEEGALRRVLKDGQRLMSEFKKLLKDHYPEKDIELLSWEEYEISDPNTKGITKKVYEYFQKNEQFRKAVIDSVKSSVKDRPFSEEEYLKLSEYVLDEFCIVYSGMYYKNNYYGLYIYPETDAVVFLIENIKSGKIFPEISSQLPKEKIGLGIVNI
jgi:tRNA-dependent cyclodipeptide synthase